MKKTGFFVVFALALMMIAIHGDAIAFHSPLKVGWVIGWDENDAVILHTRNGGRQWVVQHTVPGYAGNDISAVDKQTAWAALGSADFSSGIILHTTDGGATWTEQLLPAGVGAVKGIKGLTREEAWAAGLNGTILHTTDGGQAWNIVEHPDFPIGQVNRLDAIGFREVRTGPPGMRPGRLEDRLYSNVWIADEAGESEGHLGMIHTLYNGDLWRQETIPCVNPVCHVHMVSAYSPRVVWATAWGDGTLYRTEDGGENWDIIEAGLGANDIDDMCAYGPNEVWLVQYQGSLTGAGDIYHVRLEGGEPLVEQFQPVDSYKYEGLTCVDGRTAIVVGYTDLSDPSLPEGIILLTSDGGQNWVQQALPVDDASFWKVSFVGARR